MMFLYHKTHHGSPVFQILWESEKRQPEEKFTFAESL